MIHYGVRNVILPEAQVARNDGTQITFKSPVRVLVQNNDSKTISVI